MLIRFFNIRWLNLVIKKSVIPFQTSTSLKYGPFYVLDADKYIYINHIIEFDCIDYYTYYHIILSLHRFHSCEYISFRDRFSKSVGVGGRYEVEDQKSGCKVTSQLSWEKKMFREKKKLQ